MEHKKSENNNLVKVFFDLSNTGWEWKEESMWAIPVQSTDIFKLDNIPLLAYDISQGDVFRAELSDKGIFYFKEVVGRGGHSTFRIIFKEQLPEEKLKMLLQKFNQLGCNYEGNGLNMYAIDVPENINLEQVFLMLKQGETENVWDYEEGYVHK